MERKVLMKAVWRKLKKTMIIMLSMMFQKYSFLILLLRVFKYLLFWGYSSWWLYSIYINPV